MIIDLTSPMEATPVDNEGCSFDDFGNDYWRDELEARHEWLEFRNARVSQRYVREEAIGIVEEALLDDRMRTVLKLSSCRQIRSGVVKAIDSLDALSTPLEPMARSHHIRIAAAHIVDLDSQERKRQEAEDD